jgi:hypothetical protein
VQTAVQFPASVGEGMSHAVQPTHCAAHLDAPVQCALPILQGGAAASTAKHLPLRRLEGALLTPLQVQDMQQQLHINTGPTAEQPIALYSCLLSEVVATHLQNLA